MTATINIIVVASSVWSVALSVFATIEVACPARCYEDGEGAPRYRGG